MQAWEEINKAVALDEDDVECHRLLCEVCIETRQLDQAVLHNERALAMNPNDPRLVAQKGEVLTWLGQPADAAEWLKTAMRLDPHGAPMRAHLLGRALFGAQQYAEALEAFRRIRSPRHGHLAFMAACAAQLGRDDEARQRVAAAVALKPDLSIRSFVEGLFYREASDREHLAAGLRRAGLPE